MAWTYSKEDTDKIIESIKDPLIRELVEMVVMYAGCYGPGLDKPDFIRLEEIAKELK
jgi:hypothetical protein